MTDAADRARLPQEAIDKANGLDIGAVAVSLGARWKGEAVVDNRGTACPGCGGVDRFSVRRDKNVFFCRMSGAGGGPVDLVRHVHGCGFRAAVEHLTGKATLPVREAPRPREDKDDHFREKARRRAWAIWQSGRPPVTLVPAYLARRGIAMPDWRLRAIREIPELAYWQWSASDQEFHVIATGPAMLAAIVGPDGRFMGVHRTWIDLDRANGKMVIVDPETGEILQSKKVEGSQRGGRIVLRELDERRPALWCAINKDNIAGKATESVTHPSRTITDTLGRVRRAKVQGATPDLTDTRCLPPPAGDFRFAMLLGDGDSDTFETQAAMLRARRRFVAAGLETVIDRAPDGQDWADALKLGARRVGGQSQTADLVIGEGIETVLAWEQIRAGMTMEAAA